MSGKISFTKPTGSRSWQIVISLPSKKVYISTPNLDWGLAFAEELIGNAVPVSRVGAVAGGRLDRAPGWCL